MALNSDQTGDAFYRQRNGGRRVVWDARASHQRDTGEEKDVSDQPVVRDQFHAGNHLSFYASYPRSRGVISGFGNRTGPSLPLRGARGRVNSLQ